MTSGWLCESSGATVKTRMWGEVDLIRRDVTHLSKERGQRLY